MATFWQVVKNDCFSSFFLKHVKYTNRYLFYSKSVLHIFLSSSLCWQRCHRTPVCWCSFCWRPWFYDGPDSSLCSGFFVVEKIPSFFPAALCLCCMLSMLTCSTRKQLIWQAVCCDVKIKNVCRATNNLVAAIQQYHHLKNKPFGIEKNTFRRAWRKYFFLATLQECLS